jgi:ABC-2 type transport system permease protein
MKFPGIVRFELAYQLRRVATWLYAVVLMAFAFQSVRGNYLSDALYDDFYINGPYVIGFATVFVTIIWLLVAAAVAGQAASRDVETGMHPLTYSAPVSKAEYLGGRFFAAFVLNALLMLAIQAGIMLAVYLPGVDPRVVGPFRPAAYLTAYFFIALPNAFSGTAIQFAFAALSRRVKSSYVASVLLVFMAYGLSLAIGMILGRMDLAMLIDPIGVVSVTSDKGLNWTPIEKSTRLFELEGALLHNRLVWFGIALAALAFTHARFRFVHPVTGSLWSRIVRRREKHAPTPAAGGIVTSAIVVPDVPRTFALEAHVRQMLAIAGASFIAIARSRAGFVLWGIIGALSVAVTIGTINDTGIPLLPRTEYLLSRLTSPVTNAFSPWIILPLLTLLYAGELVWRERDAGMNEITDATSMPEWVAFLGKLLGLALVPVVWMAMLMAAGVLVQLILGYHHFELLLYVKALFGLQLVEYLLLALLALVVHVVVNQKHVGHLVILITYVLIVLASQLGIEHKMLIYGASPPWSYSDMRGFGVSLGPWMWFKLYWASWALLLAVIARLLWARGTEGSLRMRLRIARGRLTHATVLAGAAAIIMILGFGGFVFYNTNILNEYRTSSDSVRQFAEYERRFSRYARVPQPVLTNMKLRVELFPAQRKAEIRGTYRLVNRTATPIDSIHVAARPAVTRSIGVDRPANRAIADEEFGYHVYALETPLQPGEALHLSFEVHFEPKGFTNGGAEESVIENGTYFTSGESLLDIGYQRQRELMKPTERRAQGLPPRPLVPPLEDVEARQGRTGGRMLDAVIGTDADEIAVVPGALRSTWTERGRRYFHYATDAPIGEFRFLSAKYAVREDRWKDVVIRVFHHPGHAAYLGRMLESMKASLDYCTKEFSPYPYKHLTFVERPGGGRNMHAEASMIDYGERATLMNPHDPDEADLVFGATAHELAHQWWGGQLAYAPVEGAPVMSESLAWYSAFGVINDSQGPEHLWRLRRFMRQPYPIPPIKQSVPLLRALDPYASYRKGPFALYALSQYIGRDRVNGALRSLLEKHIAGTTLATTLDLYRELEAVTPQPYRSLLHDLFAANTFWELKTESVTAKKTAAGTWQVTLVVNARKETIDPAGVETNVPMNEWIEIGVFAPRKEGEDRGKPLYLQKHRIRTGRQTIPVTVHEEPFGGGIDPNFLLIDARPDDNLMKAKVEKWLECGRPAAAALRKRRAYCDQNGLSNRSRIGNGWL